MKNNFIIIFSHSNYCVTTGGTEKFISQISKLYLNQNINTLVFFATTFSKNKVGLNYNDKFVGIYNIEEIENIINNYSLDQECLGILIEHIKGYDLKKLAIILEKLEIDIILQVHDFYMICNTFNFLKNKEEFCGLTKPCQEKCKNCHNLNSIFEFEKERDFFLKKTKKLIKKIIFPSSFCMKKWLEFFPEFKNISIIRSHLISNGKYEKKENNKKIRIAYVGRKNKYKGYETWEKVISNEIIKNNYELYYFGINVSNSSNVKEIYTFNNMTEQLRKYNIDIVLLWSIIPETFSYTYYEASASGATILSNINSGNISVLIKENKNGYIFNTEEELINYLENYQQVVSGLTLNYSPLNLIDNPSLKEFALPKQITLSKKYKKVKKDIVISTLYKIKKIIELRRKI